MRLAFLAFLSTTLLFLGLSGVAHSHDATFPIEGSKLKIDAKGKKKRSFEFKATGDAVIRVANHDPAADGASLVISGVGGKKEGSTGLIRLPSENWKTVTNKDGQLTGYVYKDKKGKQGGITKVVLKNRKLQVKGGGKKWTWKPGGNHDVVWALFYLEDELYCAGFAGGSGTKVSSNKKGLFKAGSASRPAACPEQLCGNGRVELGEECDDGNLDDNDGCTTRCAVGICEGEEYDSTYEAIQSVIFDSPVYGCTNGICHGSDAPAGGLDLTAGNSYDQLVEVDAERIDGKRVRINEPEDSFLYEKLAAKVEGRSTQGTPMPSIGPALTAEHLRGVRNWIRGGAPRDLVVEGTAADLGSCLPPADPLKIPVPVPPAAGEGFQLQATPRPLGANSEDEICMSTYYDVSALVPESAKIPCPPQYAQARVCSNNPTLACTVDGDCGNGFCGTRSSLNEGDECIALNRMTVLQDPQSHHAIQYIYAGLFGLTKAEDGRPGRQRWGDFTYKFEDTSDPRHGQPCDPRDIDPAVGYNPGCSGAIQDSVACIGYGPPDYSNVGALFGVDGAAVSLNVAQEAIKDVTFPAGVYEVMPVKGLFTWNSHAFNLTSKDTTLAAYMNLFFAEGNDKLYALENIFDANSIFAQDVPPFATDEYCRTYTAPKGSHVFRLSSHTHRFGTLFRIWEPPNTPCVPNCPASSPLCTPPSGSIPRCDGPRDDAPIYYSTLYSDPVQLYFDPPVVEDENSVEDRTYLYCAYYDNGSTPTSPPVKQASKSPDPPPGVGQFLGGACSDSDLACMAGPNKGKKCFNRAAGFCDTSEGAGDGECDACPVRGGVTTEDEMFILFGDYYCPDGCGG